MPCRAVPAHHPPRTPAAAATADQFRGASALVRMASLEAAERAINSLNNSTPPGAVQSLIVRFAESAAEKAARLSRREAKTLQRLGGGMALGTNGVAAGSAAQLQQALSALSLGGGAQGQPGLPAAPLRNQLPPAPLVPQLYQPQVLSSICIKGEPGCGCMRTQAAGGGATVQAVIAAAVAACGGICLPRLLMRLSPPCCPSSLLQACPSTPTACGCLRTSAATARWRGCASSLMRPRACATAPGALASRAQLQVSGGMPVHGMGDLWSRNLRAAVAPAPIASCDSLR